MKSTQDKYWENVTKGNKIMDKNAIKEMFKSFLRFIYFGLLGLIGTFLTSLLATADLQNTVIHVGGNTFLPVGVIIVGAITGIIKLIDKYVRASENNDLNGIAPEFLQK